MPTYRHYIDKKIDPKTGMGGDHSRVIDVEAKDAEAAMAIVEKKGKLRGEVVGHVTEIELIDPDNAEVLS